MFRRISLPFLFVVAALLCVCELVISANIESDEARRHAAVLIAGCGVVALAGVVALSASLTRFLSQPLQDLVVATARVGSTDDPPRVSLGTVREMADLARTFNTMSARLAARFVELEEDRHQLRAILSGMVEGVVALDAEQRVLYVNERARELLELTGPVPDGRRLWEIVRQRPLLDLVRRALEGPEPTREEISWAGIPGRSLTLHAARLAGPPPRGAVLVVHDTSDLRRLERLRQDFVANVSHELKTPLSIIKICVETLLDGAAEDPNARNLFIPRIAEQTDRLYSLILDLLSLARIESGVETFSFKEVPLATAVQACLERHRTRAESHNQCLTGEPAVTSANGTHEELAVWADEEALDEILDNLVDNALKYTPEGGRVSVKWGVRDEFVCLEVIDTGIGIPASDLSRVFERFYRVDKARSRELGGTGLGLSIVKHLAQAMQGNVHATSTLGQGSTFCVCLPRAGI
jgi:two-component system phosphate regulon sensor histidine kinase PhoR